MHAAALIQKITEGLEQAETHRQTDEKNGLSPDDAYIRAYGYLRGLLKNLAQDMQDGQAAWPKDQEPPAENIRNALQLLRYVYVSPSDGAEDLEAAGTLLRVAIEKLEA